MSHRARSMPAMAVARTMPWPCQKCWRYIICHRCSTRVGSSPTSSCGEVLDRADDRPRVPFERRLAPAEQAVLIGEDLDEHPVPHPGVADVRFDAGDFHGQSYRHCGGGRRRLEQKIAKAAKKAERCIPCFLAIFASFCPSCCSGTVGIVVGFARPVARLRLEPARCDVCRSSSFCLPALGARTRNLSITRGRSSRC